MGTKIPENSTIFVPRGNDDEFGKFLARCSKRQRKFIGVGDK